MGLTRDELQERLSRALLRRPWVTVAGTAGVLALMFVSTPSGAFAYGTAPGWVTIATFVYMGYGTVASFFFPRVVKRRPDEIYGLLWIFAASIALVGWVSGGFGTPQWVSWVGFTVAMVSLIAFTRLALRSSRP